MKRFELLDASSCLCEAYFIQDSRTDHCYGATKDREEGLALAAQLNALRPTWGAYSTHCGAYIAQAEVAVQGKGGAVATAVSQWAFSPVEIRYMRIDNFKTIIRLLEHELYGAAAEHIKQHG